MTRVAFRAALIGAAALSLTAQAQITYTGDPNQPGGPRTGPVNLSGATLLRPLFASPAITNDFIDVDGDGFAGFDANTPPFVDQLASSYAGGAALNTFWANSYRSVGSINGFGEFVTWNLCDLYRANVPSEIGLLNRFAWASNGVKQNGPGVDCLNADPNNPRLFRNEDPNIPVDPATSNFGCQTSDGTSSNDDGSPFCRVSVDGAGIDVPGSWAVKGAIDATMTYWGNGPTEVGYGENPILSNTGWINELQSLQRVCDNDCDANTPKFAGSLNTNATPDQLTIFDTRVAWGAIVYIVNRGVGRPNFDPNTSDPNVLRITGNNVGGDIRLTDVRHLMVAGRLRHGENLAGCTRSAGSGTRNGIMNTTGIDPAWGRGDNLDNEWASTNDANLGAGRRVTNAEGSSGVERAVEVTRLGIGYTGIQGNDRAAFDAAQGRCEIANVRFDDRGTADGDTGVFVRPNPFTIVYNGDPATGWQLGGEATIVTVGDPFEDDPNQPEFMEARPVAWYLRNILASVTAFTTDPNNPESTSMPGEYLARVFFLNAGIQAVPSTQDPEIFVPTNPWNTSLAAYMAANNRLDSGDPNGTPDYASRNPAGLVPRRKTKAGGYLDGQTANYAYKDSSGTLRNIAGNGTNRLAERNEVQGDFNYDKARNVLDIPAMITAFANPIDFELNAVNAGDAGNQMTNSVIVHVIGDFDGNGDFDREDVRYFADGLALDPNNPALDTLDLRANEFGDWLNRVEGFKAVDMNSDGNFFDTTLAAGASYNAGDSRADIAGDPAGVGVVGADPRGADDMVNAADIDKVYRAFKNKYLGYDNDQVDWFDIDQAVFSDLSADMNGPEVLFGFDGVPARRTILINQADVDVIVEDILETAYGDVDLDGDVDDADEQIVVNNQGLIGDNVGWAQGNLNGDDRVDAADLAFFGPAPCAGDMNCDGTRNFADIDPFVLALQGQAAYQAQFPNCLWLNGDTNGDNTVNFGDIDPFVALLGAGACP